MAQQLSRFRSVSISQSPADAFATTSEVTGIDPSSGKAWLITGVQVQPVTLTAIYGIAADAEMSWSLTRDVKTSQPRLNDSDVIAFGGVIIPFTTSGQIVLPAVFDLYVPPGTIVVEPDIFFNVDTTGIGAVCTWDARIYYEEVKLSEVEILRLLTNG